MLHHVVKGRGTPLVVLHGARLDHRHMVETLEPVFEGSTGWQRIYVDLPGHGRSPPQPGIASQDDLLGAVLAFIDDCLEGRPFGLLGESRGSTLALGIAHHRADQAIGACLIVPGGSPTSDPGRLPPHETREPDPALRATLAPEEIDRFDTKMVVQRADIVDKTRRTKLPALSLWDEAQEARIATAFDLSFPPEGMPRVFDGPSLIIAGRQDSLSGYLDAIDLLSVFPKATLAVLDAAGHGLAWERPEVFRALVLDWLARLDRPIEPMMTAAVPELAVADAQAAQKHYGERLGFAVGKYDAEGRIGAVSRGDCGLFLRGDPSRGPGVAWIFVPDVDVIHDELRARGAGIVAPPENKPWGLRQFTVCDPWGNRLHFHHDL